MQDETKRKIKKVVATLIKYDWELSFAVHSHVIFIHECYSPQVLTLIAAKFNAIFNGDKLKIDVDDLSEDELNEQ